MLSLTTRQSIFLGLAACAPIALGVATHLEHEAAERACMDRDAEPAAEPVVEVVPQIVPIVAPIPYVAPVPVDDRAGAYAFAFVVDVPTPHLVLATATELGEGAFEAIMTGAPHYRGAPTDAFVDQPVWRDVDAARLPERARLAVGRHVRVYSAAGRVCVARIGRPVAVSERSGSIAYMGEDEVTEIGEGEDAIIDPASLWDDGRRLVVAPLEVASCEGGIWARDIALSEPLVYVADQDPAAEQDGRMAAQLPSPVARRMVQRSSALQPIAAAFAEHVRGFTDEAFTTRRLVDRLVGQRWIEPTRGGELDVFTTDGDEFGGCGGFDPAWAAIAVDAENAPVELVWADAQADYVQAVFDLDADGRPEVFAPSWLGPTHVFTLEPEGLREFAVLADVPYYGCPC
jgi:hypothetical protein